MRLRSYLSYLFLLFCSNINDCKLWTKHENTTRLPYFLPYFYLLFTTRKKSIWLYRLIPWSYKEPGNVYIKSGVFGESLYEFIDFSVILNNPKINLCRWTTIFKDPWLGFRKSLYKLIDLTIIRKRRFILGFTYEC